LWQDIRYAVRGFRRNPAFTMAAFLAIALGIGVNTGIFSILSGLVLRELPLPAADRLISIYQRFDGIRRSVHGSRSMFTTPEYRAYREGAASSVAITSYSSGLTATFGGSNPQLLEGILVGCDSASKLVISIELIQRSLAVTVCNFDVEPVSSCVGKIVPDSRTEWQPGFSPKNAQLQPMSGRIAR